MRWVVIDTNVLIADAYNPSSSSARVVSSCLDGRLVAVVSPALRSEYEWILPRAIRRPDWRGRFAAWLSRAREVEPGEVPPVVPEDPSDDMLFAAAIAGGAEAIVTNDARVLAVGQFRGIRVITPGRFLDGDEAGGLARPGDRLDGN